MAGGFWLHRKEDPPRAPRARFRTFVPWCTLLSRARSTYETVRGVSDFACVDIEASFEPSASASAEPASPRARANSCRERKEWVYHRRDSARGHREDSSRTKDSRAQPVIAGRGTGAHSWLAILRRIPGIRKHAESSRQRGALGDRVAARRGPLSLSTRYRNEALGFLK